MKNSKEYWVREMQKHDGEGDGIEILRRFIFSKQSWKMT